MALARMMAAMGGRAGSERGRGVGSDKPDASLAADARRSPDRAGVLSAALARARAGDEDAFRTVYREVQPGILRFVRGLVGDEAEDVAAETWTQIARDIGSFNGDGDGFRGWAATIARHRALDHLRRQRRRPVHTATVEELTELTAAEDTATLAIDAVSTSEAVAMIAALPRDQAEAVLLRVVMGLDAAAAGRVLGKRAGAVRTAAHRGLRRLAGQLDQRSDDGSSVGQTASTPGKDGGDPRA